jgi:hypothetical protein
VAAAEAYIQQHQLDGVQVEVETRTLEELQQVRLGTAAVHVRRPWQRMPQACIGRLWRVRCAPARCSQQHTALATW